MVSPKKHVEISVFIRQGLSIRTIGRRMRRSRNTLRRRLDLQPQRQPAVYGPQAQRVCTRAFRGLPALAFRDSRPYWIPAVICLEKSVSKVKETDISSLPTSC